MTKEQRESAIAVLAECFETCACLFCTTVRDSGQGARKAAEAFVAAAAAAETKDVS